MSNSASGGYLQPGTTEALPRSLTLTQFIQTVLVGVSALPGTLVRPKWQVAPPKQPDITTNWMAFGIISSNPETYGFVGLNVAGVTEYQRQEGLEIGLTIYGPEAESTYGLIRDGFQIQQNLESLRSANMGYTSIDRGLHMPDLINERFINRVETTLFLQRQIQRTYPILPILSATGVIHTVLGDEEYLLDWAAGT